MRLIDLSQELFSGMPAFGDHPQYNMEIAVTHEQRQKIENPTTVSPVVHKITITEHTGSHVDGFNHFGIPFAEKSIDKMPLAMFYTEAICLDLSYKGLLEEIGIEDIVSAIQKDNLEIKEKDTILLYTDHYRKHFGSDNWNNGPGITIETANWLADQGIYAFGVETRSPGLLGKGNKEIHTISGKRNFTHYENLINLQELIGKGRFRFIAFPLKIKGGTGSPVRPVAVLEEND